jgi:hypothetical protein
LEKLTGSGAWEVVLVVEGPIRRTREGGVNGSR